MDETELRFMAAVQREAHHTLLYCLITEVCEANGPAFSDRFASKVRIASMKYRNEESHEVGDHLDWFMGSVAEWLTGETGNDS